MSRVVCPECYGRCCRLHGEHGGGAYVQHTEDPEEDFSRHVCRACWDGTVLASSIVPTPCPTCGGRCCVTKRGGPADHGAAVALHACPDCKDGTRAPRLLMPTPAVEEERAAIVAFLLARAKYMQDDHNGVDDVCWAEVALIAAAKDIERGEHRKEEK